MNAEAVGRNIAEARKIKGYTQKDVAEQLHVSVAAVSKWERGLNFPDMALLEPLAAVLELSVPQLLDLTDAPADAVVKSLVELSQSEKEVLNRRFAKRLQLVLALILGFAAFLPLLMLLWLEMRHGLINPNRLLTVLLPIFLGLCAWFLPAVPVLGVRRGLHLNWQRWSLLSFICCMASLYYPVYTIDYLVQINDVSAILDTVGGFHFASVVLLCGTALANGCSYLLNRKR